MDGSEPGLVHYFNHHRIEEVRLFIDPEPYPSAEFQPCSISITVRHYTNVKIVCHFISKLRFFGKKCVFKPKGYNIINAPRGERTGCRGMVSAASAS